MNESIRNSSAGQSGTRFERGLAILGEISGTRGAAVVDSLADIAPDLGRFVVEWAYADLYDRAGLDLPERELVTVGALAALGDTAAQLNFHIDAALQVGVTPVEVVEALIHLVPFTGFPRVLNAIGVARAAFADHGVTIEPPVMDDDRDRYQRGADKLVEIDGQHGPDVIASLQDIAPDLGRYIVEFAFGDVYHRPWLPPRRKQLVTVAALTALGDTAPQLRVHIGAALNVGLTPAQIVETLTHVAAYAGFPRVLNAVRAARDVFEERNMSVD
ncbi:carboxymuconolactone decarboxylase family protein [Streptomyces sp. HNM0663]|uniref:Carboxymuconolactone decarboxylase family protein n=1 Tax=Streptomyces chengmaiensis TaxID=3040919 RepID=A0ABT6HSD4_9ACTN|nr:carboxymuconolactone decarboxylase family protein [Streptomyces chengmaiensis]MDH2391173.1 carboxymuconolactone decarboxylase family protein [Streptomyces chengmaiensis]